MEDVTEKQGDYSSVLISAMNYLAGREHSEKELREKLLRKDFSLELIDQVLHNLKMDNLLNDERFTESFIRSRVNKGFGPVKINYELSQKGISRELIEQYLSSDNEFWQPVIEQIRLKRFGRVIPDSFEEQSKQSRYLYQRGFGSDLIRHCFND